MNAKDEDWQNGPHGRHLGGSLKLVEFLIDKGADVNAKNKNGRNHL